MGYFNGYFSRLCLKFNQEVTLNINISMNHIDKDLQIM